MIGIVGRKIGMTQIFNEQGQQIPCTVIEAEPNPVVAVSDKAKVGYTSAQLGLGASRMRRESKKGEGRPKGHRASLAAVGHAKKAGLDISQARELIGGGAAGSWAFENYGPKILGEDWSPGFSVKNQRKDFGYCREASLQIDAAIPGTDLVDRLLESVDDPEWTTAALYEVLLRMGAAG